MPYNEILHPTCNIGTYDHIVFTKSLRSYLQEFLGKLLFPLEFLLLYPIFILVCNEWFGWIYTIWVCNSKASLLLFHDFIFPHTSPIIWLLCSCHLDHTFFIQYNELLPLLHVAFYCYIGRTKLYQALPLVTCRMNYWRRVSSNRSCYPLWLTIKRLILLYPIFILVCNEWFGWIYTIWVCNSKASLLLFHDFIFPHTSPIIWLLCSCHLDHTFFIQYNELLPLLHVAFYCYIGRTKLYQALPLVTCRMNYWRRVSSNRSCYPLWLTIKRLILVADSWCLVCISQRNSLYSGTFLLYPVELRFPMPPENWKGTKMNAKGTSSLPALQLIYIRISYVGLNWNLPSY